MNKKIYLTAFLTSALAWSGNYRHTKKRVRYKRTIKNRKA